MKKSLIPTRKQIKDVMLILGYDVDGNEYLFRGLEFLKEDKNSIEYSLTYCDSKSQYYGKVHFLVNRCEVYANSVIKVMEENYKGEIK